ncbi:MAG: hypothetical protein ACFCAD_13765 [Pleurocapsa sp.]
MSNFVQNLVIGILCIALFLWFLSISSGWNELSKRYKIEQCCPSAFITNQQGIFRTHSDKNSTVIRPLNIGVSEEGLYLFTNSSFSNEIFYPSLLIPWSEIEYLAPQEQSDTNKRHTFSLGNPTVSLMRLYPQAIEKLEEEYGEPIFSNKLGELN